MYTIGSDPEFFVRQKEGKATYPAFHIVSGTKEAPLALGEGYSVLYDNVLIEGNLPPVTTKEAFISNIGTLKSKMNTLLKDFNCELYESDVELFESDALQDERAKEFGCLPFNDAWTFEEMNAPEILEHWRTAGFHIHVGYENISNYPKEIVNIAIARAFDFFAILPANSWRRDSRRDKNYGGYGKFRHKPYGLELRGLSGYFAKDDMLSWVYDQTIKTVDFVLKGNLVETILDLSPSDITWLHSKEKLGVSFEEQKVIKQPLVKTYAT